MLHLRLNYTYVWGVPYSNIVPNSKSIQVHYIHSIYSPYNYVVSIYDYMKFTFRHCQELSGTLKHSQALLNILKHSQAPSVTPMHS